MKDINGNVINSFRDNISIGNSVSPDTPLEAWATPGNGNVTLQWCGVNNASDYLVSYRDEGGTINNILVDSDHDNNIDNDVM